ERERGGNRLPERPMGGAGGKDVNGGGGNNGVSQPRGGNDDSPRTGRVESRGDERGSRGGGGGDVRDSPRRQGPSSRSEATSSPARQSLHRDEERPSSRREHRDERRGGGGESQQDMKRGGYDDRRGDDKKGGEESRSGGKDVVVVRETSLTSRDREVGVREREAAPRVVVVEASDSFRAPSAAAGTPVASVVIVESAPAPVVQLVQKAEVAETPDPLAKLRQKVASTMHSTLGSEKPAASSSHDASAGVPAVTVVGPERPPAPAVVDSKPAVEAEPSPAQEKRLSIQERLGRREGSSSSIGLEGGSGGDRESRGERGSDGRRGEKDRSDRNKDRGERGDRDRERDRGDRRDKDRDRKERKSNRDK
ncbi:hypothetical protein HDU98_006034, partial [Podochytrium sp. JEL0797]